MPEHARHLLRGYAIAFSLLTSLQVQGAGVSELEAIESPRPARPLIVVPPEFPSEAGTLKDPVVVEIVGTVSRAGELVVRSMSGPENFAGAVSEVIRLWRFGPAIDNASCRATDGEILVQVSFEGSPEDPHIFVSTDRRSTPARNAELLSSFEWTYRQEPRWPRSAKGREGDVRLLFWLTPEGTVKDASVYSSFPPGVFDDAVIDAITHWKARWLREVPANSICMEQSISFCQVGRHDEPSYSGCD